MSTENPIVDETKTCALESCGTVFARDGRRPAAWTSMRFCTAACASKQRAIDVGGQGRTKPCQREGCDELIVKVPAMSNSYWETRKYHNRECQGLAMRAANNQEKMAVPPKDCENPACDQKIVFNVNSTNKNARALFRRRKYCSMTCQMASKRERTQGRLANKHRDQRPVTSSRRLTNVMRNVPPAPPREAGPVWRPAGFKPEPIIPGHIKAWNARNVQPEQEKEAS